MLNQVIQVFTKWNLLNFKVKYIELSKKYLQIQLNNKGSFSYVNNYTSSFVKTFVVFKLVLILI